MKQSTTLFPEFEGTVDTLFQEWQAEADKAIAELEPEPSLKAWLSGTGDSSTPDQHQ